MLSPSPTLFGFNLLDAMLSLNAFIHSHSQQLAAFSHNQSINHRHPQCDLLLEPAVDCYHCFGVAM